MATIPPSQRYEVDYRSKRSIIFDHLIETNPDNTKKITIYVAQLASPGIITIMLLSNRYLDNRTIKDRQNAKVTESCNKMEALRILP